MSFAPIILTALGGLVSTVGMLQQGKAQAAAAEYQAQVARNNQIMMQQNAAYERQKGEVDQQAQDMKNKALRGAQEAAQGASGFDVNDGSLVDLRASSAELSRLDSLTVRSNAERKGRDFDIAASNAGASAQMYDAQASATRSAMPLGILSSLLGTASAVGSKWNAYKMGY